MVTIVLFFPVLLDALLKKADPLSNGNSVLSWGPIIGLLIVGYIFLECVKTWHLKVIPKALNLMFFIILGSFVSILYMFAGVQQSDLLPEFLYYVLVIALNMIRYIPAIIIILLLVNAVAPLFQEKGK